MSAAVILAESSLFIDFPIAVLPLLFEDDYGIIFTQIICLIPFSYILYCTYFGLFYLKLPGLYGLYKQNTEPSSLVYSASYLARLSAPLAYNFFLLSKINNTVFSETMGFAEIHNKYAKFLPLSLIILSFLNYIHAYGRVLNLLGISQLSYLDESQAYKIDQGKSMIKRERLAIEKNKKYAETVSDWEMINIEIIKDSYNKSKLLP